MEKTKVSACIVTYGGYREAAQAAESLLRHTTGVDLSLYLVDNASPDGTGEKLQQAQPQWGPRVQVMRLARNMGFGAGHNAVLPVLNSKYHAVVNPDITLDEDAHTAAGDHGEIDLTPREFELLASLMKNAGKVVSREDLLRDAWGWEYLTETKTVDTHIKRLREKLEGVSSQWSLKTVWGVGYKFEVTNS